MPIHESRRAASHSDSVTPEDDLQNLPEKDRVALSLERRLADAFSDEVPENTRRALLSDLRRFRKHVHAPPAHPNEVAAYLWANRDKRVSTLRRWTASISDAHKLLGFDNPCRSDLVRSMLKRIAQLQAESGQVQRRRAQPIFRDDLLALTAPLKGSAVDLRDKAILLVGFSGALNRSELCAINLEDLEWRDNAVVISLRRGKEGTLSGETVTIAAATRFPEACPIAALAAWIKRIAATPEAPTQCGPLFRRIGADGEPTSVRLRPQALNDMVKARAAAAGLPAGITAHSMRAGIIAQAHRDGLDPHIVAAHTRNRHIGNFMKTFRADDAETGKDAPSLL